MKKTLAAIVILLGIGIAGRMHDVSIASAQVSVANNAAELSGKIVMLADGAVQRTVTNLFTFSRATATPFSVNNGAAAVPNLLNWTFVTITTTGTQSNFAPGLVGDTVLICNNAALLTITGFGGPVDGQHVLLISKNAEVDLSHDVTSTTSNRLFNTVTSGPTRLIAGATRAGHALYIYSSAEQRWLLIDHAQGAPITPTYSGTDFTASGTMAWGVDSGDRTTMTYILNGNMLTVTALLATTSVTAPLSTALIISNAQWGGYSASKSISHPGATLNDNATGFAAGHLIVGTALGGTTQTIQIFKYPSGNYAAAANTTHVSFVTTFEVS